MISIIIENKPSNSAK